MKDYWVIGKLVYLVAANTEFALHCSLITVTCSLQPESAVMGTEHKGVPGFLPPDKGAA